VSLLRSLSSERRDFSGPWGPYADGRIPPPGLDGLSTTGAVVTEASSMQLIDAYACVSLRSDALSMLPVRAYRKDGDVRKALDSQPQLLRQPDPEMEPVDYWSGMSAALVLRGNAYSAVVERDAVGYPTAVKILHPDDVTPERQRGTGSIEYRLTNGNTVSRFDMIHVRGFTLPGSLTGLGRIECARRGLGAAMATEDFGAKWFRDGAAPSSVLETEQPMDETNAKLTVAKWVASHGGRRRPALLTHGLKWRPITITPEESQFLETRKFNTTQTARLFRIPPHMIGDLEKSTSWGKGIEEQGIGFVVYTLGPDMVRFEQAFSRQVPRPQYVKFNPAALLRGNTKDRYTAYAVGRQWGWLSVNDIRELEDLPPIEGGDVYLQPLNMIEAKEALDMLLTDKGRDE
jgi:HK97 family phage portal protein